DRGPGRGLLAGEIRLHLLGSLGGALDAPSVVTRSARDHGQHGHRIHGAEETSGALRRPHREVGPVRANQDLHASPPTSIGDGSSPSSSTVVCPWRSASNISASLRARTRPALITSATAGPETTTTPSASPTIQSP